MSVPQKPERAPRPATPILDAWRREMRRRYGHPVPAAAVADQVGSPTWLAAAWEAAAVQAWADGASEATVAGYLLRPYQILADALEDDDVALAPADQAFIDQVRRARGPLSVGNRIAVLRLAERAEVGLSEAAG